MSALDELAAYLGAPDRPFGARALELVQAALLERGSALPPKGHMGDDLDFPFELAGDGSTLELKDAVLAGGWVVSASMVPVPGAGPCPALVFRFHRYDGHILRPVVLILDAEQMSKVPSLVEAAAHTAIRAAS